MTDASVSDFVARDESGEPTTTAEVEINGEPLEVEFVPATKGFMSELDGMDPEEVEDEGMRRVLEHYRTPDFREDGTVPQETVDNIPLPRLGELFDTYLIGSGVDEDVLENPEEYVEELEGNPNQTVA